MRPLVHEPMKTTSSFWPAIDWPGLEAHVGERALEVGSGGRLDVGRRGDPAADRHAHARVGAVGDHRFERVAVDDDRPVVGRAVVAGQLAPARRRPRPRPLPAARTGGPSRYSNVVSSGAMSPARAPPSIDMLQTVIRSSIERARMASPVYSKTWPVPPPTPMRAIRARMMSLAPDARLEPARHLDLERLRLALEQRLRGQDHLDLARPDAERQRPEGAVRGGVGVAADDGHARLRQPQLRPDDVDDAARRASPCRGTGCRTRGSSPRSGRSCLAGQLVGDRAGTGPVVGIEWSAVATVWPGLRTFRPRSRRPVKACGLVTSWTR